MRASKIRDLLQQGREGEKAAAKVCRDLHERRLMQDTNIILQMMIDHCVNSDFEWPVAADEGALMWYYMGKSRNAPEIREEHNREVYLAYMHNKLIAGNVGSWGLIAPGR